MLCCIQEMWGKGVLLKVLTAELFLYCNKLLHTQLLLPLKTQSENFFLFSNK